MIFGPRAKLLLTSFWNLLFRQYSFTVGVMVGVDEFGGTVELVEEAKNKKKNVIDFS